MQFKSNRNTVRHFTLEVDYPELDSAREFQSKIASLVKSRLVSILESLCEKYGSDKLIRVAEIDLDLGTISKADVDTLLPRLFEKKLLQIFSGFDSEIYERKEVKGVEVVDEEKLLLQYFRHYLTYGYLPWHLESAFKNASFSEVLSFFIEQDKPVFWDAFYSILENENARKRLMPYIDSGELQTMLKLTLPGEAFFMLKSLKDSLEQYIVDATQIEPIARSYLRVYLKDFLLLTAREIYLEKKSFDQAKVFPAFFTFIVDTKGLLPEKWLPYILEPHLKKAAFKTQQKQLLASMLDTYMDYLVPDTGSWPGKEDEPGKKKEQLLKQFTHLQPATGKAFHAFVTKIIEEATSYLTKDQGRKLDKFIWSSVFEFLKPEKFEQKDLRLWLTALSDFIEKKTGISSKELIPEVLKDMDAEYVDQEMIPESEEALKVRGFDILLARDYWSLFLRAGIQPFYKIYTHPENKLMDLFSKYLYQATGDAEKVMKTISFENLALPGIWIKESFGEELFRQYLKLVEETKEQKLSDEIEYEDILLRTFLRTGSFPWPEIAKTGYQRLLQMIGSFEKPEKRPRLIHYLKSEKFFEKKEVMEAVFSVMPISFGKELLKIRNELMDEQEIESLQEDDFAVHPMKEEQKQKQKQRQGMSLDQLASLIINFNNKRLLTGYTVKEQAELIYEKIRELAVGTPYETAAMLVGLEDKVINYVMKALTKNKQEFVQKLVRKYRIKFVSLASDIEESEKKDKELHIKIEQDEETSDTWFVRNAGLVLLNPYLKRLFARFNLTLNKDFISDEAREKAIHILQYLATGREDAEEHELILNKIIVGLPLQQPLKFSIRLTGEDKKICDGLLNSIITNWEALKNTSLEGLRASFFLRQGSITREVQGWRLHVEKKAFDVLLKKLPWGYAMLHMPWMEIPLYTDWEDQ